MTWIIMLGAYLAAFTLPVLVGLPAPVADCARSAKNFVPARNFNGTTNSSRLSGNPLRSPGARVDEFGRVRDAQRPAEQASPDESCAQPARMQRVRPLPLLTRLDGNAEKPVPPPIPRGLPVGRRFAPDRTDVLLAT